MRALTTFLEREIRRNSTDEVIRGHSALSWAYSVFQKNGLTTNQIALLFTVLFRYGSDSSAGTDASIADEPTIKRPSMTT